MGGVVVALAFYSMRRATANPSGRNSETCTNRTELLLAIEPATGMQENTVALGGFFAGVTLMLALQILLPEYNYGRKSLGGGGT